MRVLYSFPDGIGRPGIGTTAFNQVREIALRDVGVTLYCTSLHGELPPGVEVVETLAVGSRRIPHRTLGVGRSYRYHDLRVAATLRRRGSEFDAVHCWPRATIGTCRAARRAGIPTFREVPNTHTGHAFEVVSAELQRLGLSPVRGHSHTYDARALAREEEEFQVADHLLVPSEYSRETFLERGYPDDKLVLHRYGYDPDRFFPSPNGAGSSPSRPFTALFVGSVEPRKGLHHGLRAWIDSGAGDRGRFVICGGIDPEYRALLAPLLEHPSVEARGFVSDPAEVMRQSDVLVLPSLEEGSALVTYEAQACGCVLAVSEAAGARCRDGVEGLVHRPGDVQTLATQLARLATDEALLERLRAASLAQSATLTWGAAADELVGIYRTNAR